MPATIVGLGTANPTNVLSREDATNMIARLCAGDKKQERLVGAMVRLTGVEQRQTCVPHEMAYEWEGQEGGPTVGERMQLYEQFATPLSLESAKAALDDAGIAPGEVTHIVTVSCTGFEAPGVDIRLIQQLGLADSTQRTNIGFMGCQAAVNAIRTTQGLLAANPDAVVLAIATELCSLHYCYGWKPDQMVGNVIFGDGSAAFVAKNQPAAESDDACDWQLVATGSKLITEAEAQMSWLVRDNGFEMVLSPELPGTIERHIHGWLNEWLGEQGMSLEGIRSWAVHPGGPKIVDAVQKSLNIPDEGVQESHNVLRDHGNMSSPTMLFVMERLRKRQVPGPCLALAFGPGIAAEAALFR